MTIRRASPHVFAFFSPLGLLLLATTAILVPTGALAQRIGPCPVFPQDNIWNARVDQLPLDARSNDYVDAIGAFETGHPDFGSGIWPPVVGGPMGIPVTTVEGDQPRVAISFLYEDESDPGPYPVPTDAQIEGGAHSQGDRHVLVVDTGNCVLYELFNAFPEPDGSWSADSGAVFDLNSNGLRPDGWTSADAAGLPILAGLVRYEEVAAGEIRHALRFTAPRTRKAHVWPARHDASDRTEDRFPPMGARFRLRADFDTTDLSAEVQVILRALKTYGMMLADNGSPWYFTGVPDERWDNEALSQLRRLRGSDFEAVDVSSLMVHPDSGATKPAAAEPFRVFLPQIGDGIFSDLRLVTKLILVGQGPSAEVVVEFFDSAGQPMNLEFLGHPATSDLHLSLGRGQSRTFQTTGTGAARVGYTQVTATASVAAIAVLTLQHESSGVVLSEASVPAVSPAREFMFPIDSLGHADTGLALLHPPGDPVQGPPAHIIARLHDPDFEAIGEAELTGLAAGNQVALFVHQLFSDSAVAERAREMEGVVTIESDVPLAAVVLRQQDDPRKSFPEDVPTLTVFPVVEGVSAGVQNARR